MKEELYDAKKMRGDARWFKTYCDGGDRNLKIDTDKQNETLRNLIENMKTATCEEDRKQISEKYKTTLWTYIQDFNNEIAEKAKKCFDEANQNIEKQEKQIKRAKTDEDKNEALKIYKKTVQTAWQFLSSCHGSATSPDAFKEGPIFTIPTIKSTVETAYKNIKTNYETISAKKEELEKKK